MEEKTARRIARALEQLAGNTTNTSINIKGLIKSLVKTHDKLQIVKVIKDIEVCSLKRAKEIVDPIFKECTRKLGGYNN
jgi:ribosomal protein L7/L12